MGITYLVQFTDDFDLKTTATVPGAPGQAVGLPAGWIEITVPTNPPTAGSTATYYLSSQANVDAMLQQLVIQGLPI